MKNLNIIHHPILQASLSRLREIHTGPEEFRHQARRIVSFLAIEALANLPIRQHSVTTPMGQTMGFELSSQVILVPILRAGLGLVEPILDLVPNATVWHVGLYRNETTLEPVEYYNKIPKIGETAYCLVLDPMMATAGSAIKTCQILKDRGASNIRMVCLLAAPEGIRNFHSEFPDIPIFTASVDSHLNEIGYIVPGLGDAGDRMYHTNP